MTSKMKKMKVQTSKNKHLIKWKALAQLGRATVVDDRLSRVQIPHAFHLFFLERRSEMFKGGVIIRLTWMNIILIGGAAFVINKIWSNTKEDKKNDRN